VFPLFSKNVAKQRGELALLVAEQEKKLRLRQCRRQWAIEQANFACPDSSIEEIMRAARLFYSEAFGDGWDE
jgi:hypothetical protein